MRNDAITLQQASGVAVITLNRPELLNAIDDETIDVFPRLVDEASRNDAMTYLVIAGSGDTFCSGGGVDFLLRLSNEPEGVRRDVLKRGQRWVNSLMSSPCMVVAAVDGLAVGAGVDVLLAADAALLTPQAKLNLWFAKVGAIPDLGGLQLLAEAIGPRSALHEYARCRPLSPEAVQAIGLGEIVNELPKGCDAWSAFLRRRFPISRGAFSAAKSLLNAPRLAELATHQEQVTIHQASLFATETFRSTISRIRSVQAISKQSV